MKFTAKTTVIKISMDQDGNVTVTKHERDPCQLAFALVMTLCSLAE